MRTDSVSPMSCAPRHLELDSSFESQIRLADNRPVRLRWIRSTDATLLRDGFARLSPESRLMRFFSPIPELPERFVRYLIDIDGYDHAALIAASPPPEVAGRSERGFGVARFIRSQDDRASAELAVTVTDDVQGQGLGHQLVWTLAAAARERCIETFTMSVLWSNARVRGMLRRLGAESRGRDGDIVEYAVAIPRMISRVGAPPRAASPSLRPRAGLR
jgi:GNAT superfamily N-acetyltransferase